MDPNAAWGGEWGDRGWVYYIGVVIVEGEWAVLGVNLGHPIVTNKDSDTLFPNYFGEDLL